MKSTDNLRASLLLLGLFSLFLTCWGMEGIWFALAVLGLLTTIACFALAALIE